VLSELRGILKMGKGLLATEWRTMAGNGRPRRGADEALALALATGATVRDAASTAGIGERTAHRRLDDPAFHKRVSELRAALIDAAAGKVATAMTAAAHTLEGLLAAESETVRLAAAKALIELGVKLRDSTDHEQRLKALEHLGEWVRLQPRGAA
jgi:hypothetical protein